MTTTLILNQSQAEAVYSAMCALNNVGGRMRCTLADNSGDIDIYERSNGSIQILGNDPESHESQSAFATAYGLQQG